MRTQDRRSFLFLLLLHHVAVAACQTHRRRRQAVHVTSKLGHLRRFRSRSASIDVQRRIADILSAYDDLIENNRRRMALLEEAARQLYREWFVRLRFPGHEHTRIHHWRAGGVGVVRLGDIATKIGSGCDSSRWQVSLSGRKALPLISQISTSTMSVSNDDGLAFMTTIQAAQLSHVTVEPRDILLNITGASVARCCMVSERHLPGARSTSTS